MTINWNVVEVEKRMQKKGDSQVDNNYNYIYNYTDWPLQDNTLSYSKDNVNFRPASQATPTNAH